MHRGIVTILDILFEKGNLKKKYEILSIPVFFF